jgi:hypothetical protein
MPETWFIGLDAWIIQDGNYPDFRVGQTCLFAVEFIPEDDLRVATGDPDVRRIDDDRYSVTARVTASAVAVKSYVIDLGGLMAYRALPGGAEQFVEGQTLQGHVSLGIDPYDYFETLGYRNDFPPLLYQWTIVGLLLQTAPWVEVAPRTRARDRSKWKWVEIQATDGWEDDDGSASYLLECHRDATEPIRPPRPIP